MGARMAIGTPNLSCSLTAQPGFHSPKGWDEDGACGDRHVGEGARNTDRPVPGRNIYPSLVRQRGCRAFDRRGVRGPCGWVGTDKHSRNLGSSPQVPQGTHWLRGLPALAVAPGHGQSGKGGQRPQDTGGAHDPQWWGSGRYELGAPCSGQDRKQGLGSCEYPPALPAGGKKGGSLGFFPASCYGC